jgi:hypothetical protein
MRRAVVATALVFLWSSSARAQTTSERGFVEGRGFFFPQAAPNDPARAIEDVLFREEVFLKPSGWIQFAAGLDLRANSHDQVENEWRLDFTDRGVRRPRAAIRRLTATLTSGGFTLDIGKQFIRWGRADVLNPTDRFAPRDFLNVIDTDFLPVLGVRPMLHVGKETFEAVWVPRLTPSRLPLFNQRWTVLPADLRPISVVDGGSRIPQRSEQGVRWNHAGEHFETALTYFDGSNHLPNIDVRAGSAPLTAVLTRVYPDLRTYGGDMIVPTGWFTLKGEAEYFTSPSSTNEEYVLYVVEVERQTGEWVLVGGYAGEVVTTSHEGFPFAPDRGIARSILGRASFTVDPRRTVAIEGAVRQGGEGFYVKGEYSEAFGQHWRLTLTGVGIAGDESDFLGEFHRNSHGSIALRFSF